MENDISSAWGWVVVIGTVVLGVALAYAVSMWSRRSRSSEAVSEQETKRVYREAEREAQREQRG
jgi:type II secretory pathway pseudopilin PulG